ncbi:hypothetical protein Tdes44962_MAKER05057 [Teratosphaeria destructans]|uniref:Uncharacterized protein n=1 Tax=Teratosphaeria destructans TaxID=418781 RepID=A0A9W7SLG3_9PEZI|nr:hypothetical protein Tdes44962_MAKER05057 [Teratosphaeria destructans]
MHAYATTFLAVTAVGTLVVSAAPTNSATGTVAASSATSTILPAAEPTWAARKTGGVTYDDPDFEGFEVPVGLGDGHFLTTAHENGTFTHVKVTDENWEEVYGAPKSTVNPDFNMTAAALDIIKRDNPEHYAKLTSKRSYTDYTQWASLSGGNCYLPTISSTDHNNAVYGMLNLDDGACNYQVVQKNSLASYVSGDAAAAMCNYGNAQMCKPEEMLAALMMMFPDGAPHCPKYTWWNDNDTWKKGYAVDAACQVICPKEGRGFGMGGSCAELKL